MKRLATLLTALLFLSSTAYGQDGYYYSDERKIPIEKSESWKVVQTAPAAGPALTRALAGRSDLRLRKAIDTERGFYWLAASGRQALDAAALDGLAAQVPVQRSFPVFFRLEPRGDTTRFAMTDEFCVQFEAGVTRAEIDDLNAKYGVEIFLKDARDEQQARDYNEYLLRVTEASPLSTLEVANRYYESALTEWSVPNFYMNYRPDGPRASGARRAASPRTAANDPLYDEQYYLHSTSSNLGTADVDIDAPEAWSITKGSSSITVAVFDDGTEQHEDFYSGQVVSGYTAGGGDGSPEFSGDAHGQAVAGIIAANHNTKGVRGVAPNVRIMPVKILGESYGDATADVIDDAWQNGADVLSNSWSGSEYAPIEAAFLRARENGRNGKGSVIIKSAGNTGGSVTFPATVPGMLVVGAVDKDDNVWYYSPRDTEVDIVAPSGDLSGNGDVRTTDRMGSAGYVAGNYYDSFGGTSAAAPQASGVAALILSEYPQLTEDVVRIWIEDGADDYGSTSWDGHGRLNAQEALTPPPIEATIQGPSCVMPGGNQQPATWSAQTHGAPGYYGGVPGYTLQWYESCNGAATPITPNAPSCENGWRILANGPTAEKYVDYGEDDFHIRLEITDSQNASDFQEWFIQVDNCFDGPPTGPQQQQAQTRADAAQTTPTAFALGANSPNPFNPTTEIRFALPEATQVRLVVYDVLGREVATLLNRPLEAGRHRARFDAVGLPSGTYFYRLEAGSFVETRRMTLVK